VAASLTPRRGDGRAPGKVILLGEHAVVYGRTAIAASIDRHVTVRLRAAHGRPRAGTAAQRRRDAAYADPRTAAALQRAGALLEVDTDALDVSIASTLPTAVGLGSSAALSVALIRALADFAGRRLDTPAVCAAALELEKVFHGFPSGVDNSAAAHGGLITFRSGSVAALRGGTPLRLVAALTRAERQTRSVVAALRQRRERDAARHEALFDAIDALASEARDAIAAGRLAALGRLMSGNHELLRALGVSTPELDAMVALAAAHGALGAKLTGGGGGGAMIALAVDDGRHLVDAFTAAGWQAFGITIAPRRTELHASNDRTAAPCVAALS
jgi:hydroxymethylglutaryl-CoA reductase